MGGTRWRFFGVWNGHLMALVGYFDLDNTSVKVWFFCFCALRFWYHLNATLWNHNPIIACRASFLITNVIKLSFSIGFLAALLWAVLLLSASEANFPTNDAFLRCRFLKHGHAEASIVKAKKILAILYSFLVLVAFVYASWDFFKHQFTWDSLPTTLSREGWFDLIVSILMSLIGLRTFLGIICFWSKDGCQVQY